MRLYLADGLIVIGALIAVGGAIRGTVAYIRYFRSPAIASADPVNRAINSLEFVYATSLAAVITGGGIVVLVAGLIFGNGVRAWTILMPVGLAAGGAISAWYSRRTVDRLDGARTVQLSMDLDRRHDRSRVWPPLMHRAAPTRAKHPRVRLDGPA